jgi:hypothetical protein
MYAQLLLLLPAQCEAANSNILQGFKISAILNHKNLFLYKCFASLPSCEYPFFLTAAPSLAAAKHSGS